MIQACFKTDTSMYKQLILKHSFGSIPILSVCYHSGVFVMGFSPHVGCDGGLLFCPVAGLESRGVLRLDGGFDLVGVL